MISQAAVSVGAVQDALGDVVTGKEFLPVACICNQIGQILNGLAHPVVADNRVKNASLLYCFNHFPCSVLMSASALAYCTDAGLVGLDATFAFTIAAF